MDALHAQPPRLLSAYYLVISHGMACSHLGDAVAASHTKATYLSTKFRRFASRKGRKRAAIMVAHRILEAAYFIIRDKVPYRE